MIITRQIRPGDVFDLQCGGRVTGATIFAIGTRTLLVLLDSSTRMLALPRAALRRIDWYANAGQA